MTDFPVDNSLNVYVEMISQASQGNIAAVIPLKSPQGTSMGFFVAANPMRDPEFNPKDWLNDQTDYSGIYDGADFFGTDGIGVKYAMAMIQYAHYVAHENGLDRLYSEDEDS